LRAVGKPEHISGEPERLRLQLMAVLDQKRLKRGDEFKHHLVDIADNERTFAQAQLSCSASGMRDHCVSPAPPSAWKARATDSGFVPVAAQKSISVGSWFIKKPRTPCKKTRLLRRIAQIICFEPCQRQEAAHQFGLAGKPDQHRDCCIFCVFHSVLLMSNSGIGRIRDVRLPLFQPNETKLTALNDAKQAIACLFTPFTSSRYRQPVGGGVRRNKIWQAAGRFRSGMGTDMTKQVMIVEDNELNMKLFRDLIEASGYKTVQTRNGMEAMDLARQHRPDLILMDIQLPEVSGLEVTKWLKQDDDLHVYPCHCSYGIRDEGR
jgi:hypothetical protein